MILAQIICFFRCRDRKKTGVKNNSCHPVFILNRKNVKTRAIFLVILGIPGAKDHLREVNDAKTMKYRSEETVPHCLECGNPLPYGRKDRKYCSPACKNRSHNREARQWRFRYSSVIGILEKNHDILRHLIQIGVRSIPKEELAQLGYRLGFVTSSGRKGSRTVCRCFDIVFTDMETRISGLAVENLPWSRDEAAGA